MDKLYRWLSSFFQEDAQRRANKKLEQELDLIFQAFPDLSLRINSTGKVLDCRGGMAPNIRNREWPNLGQSVYYNLPTGTADTVRDAVQWVNETHSSISIEYELLSLDSGADSDTSSELFEARLLPLGREEIVIVIRNITENRQTIADLERAKEAAESASAAKTEFLTNMSHELRTPLNGILGYTQLLQMDDELDDCYKEDIQVIEESGYHLLRLIEELLDVSTIESGQINFRLTEFSLPKLLNSVVDMVKIPAMQKDIALNTAFDSNLPQTIVTDRERLLLVLFNLLENAVEFTEIGTVLLRVVANDESIRFEVVDTGVGIRPTVLAKLFDPFEQIGYKRYHSNGRGMALAISQKIIQLMGGKIEVESTPGKGSRFWFELPFPTQIDDQ